jgi:hypothetical protein
MKNLVLHSETSVRDGLSPDVVSGDESQKLRPHCH